MIVHSSVSFYEFLIKYGEMTTILDKVHFEEMQSTIHEKGTVFTQIIR